jgi:hypothetical protein
MSQVRWYRRIVFLVLMICFSFKGFVQGQQKPENPRITQALTEARQVSDDLSNKVRDLLFQELKGGGPAGAVRVCSEVAQEVTQEFRTRTGHSVRRVSIKYRNLKDIPDDYEHKKLEAFDLLNRQKNLGTEYFHVVEEGGREYLRYMRPLVIAPLCLTCHGTKEQIPAEVKAILLGKYPDDRATDYNDGDLRGAISVKIGLPSK